MRRVINPAEVEPITRFGVGREKELLGYLGDLVGQASKLLPLDRPERLYLHYEPGVGYMTQEQLALTENALDQISRLLSRGLYPLLADLSGKARHRGGQKTEYCPHAACLVFNQVLDSRFLRLKGYFLRTSREKILSLVNTSGFSGDIKAAYDAVRAQLPRDSTLVEGVLYHHRLDARLALPQEPILCPETGHLYQCVVRVLVSLAHHYPTLEPFLVYDSRYGFPSEEFAPQRYQGRLKTAVRAVLKRHEQTALTAPPRFRALFGQKIPEHGRHGSLVSWLSGIRASNLGLEDYHRVVLSCLGGTAYLLVRALAQLGYEAGAFRRRRGVEQVAQEFYTGRLTLPVF